MDLNQELRSARKAFADGKSTISELTCRRILAVHPDCAAAWALLGSIATRAGAVEQAAIFFGQADAARPAAGLLARTARAIWRKRDLWNARKPSDGASPGNRYLLIKSWGYGFWSDVSQVLGGLLLAEITQRVPLVHWGKNSLFGDRSGRDAFRNYFEPVSDLSLPDLVQHDNVTFFPPKWTRANLTEENIAKWKGAGSRLGIVEYLNRPEMVAVVDFYVDVINAAPWLPVDHPMHGQSVRQIYRYLIGKYLRPQQAVRARCDSFYDAHLFGAPFVAVHLRGSDKIKEEKTLEATNGKIEAALAEMPQDFRIFLLTDDESFVTLAKGKYGDRVVTTQCQRTSSAMGVHYLPTTDPVQAGLEVMTDAYLAQRADRFIGNGSSNVARMIAVLRDWNPADCMLLGMDGFRMSNLALYRDFKGPRAAR